MVKVSTICHHLSHNKIIQCENIEKLNALHFSSKHQEERQTGFSTAVPNLYKELHTSTLTNCTSHILIQHPYIYPA